MRSPVDMPDRMQFDVDAVRDLFLGAVEETRMLMHDMQAPESVRAKAVDAFVGLILTAVQGVSLIS